MFIRLRKGETLTVASFEAEEIYTIMCKEGFLGIREFEKTKDMDLGLEKGE